MKQWFKEFLRKCKLKRRVARIKKRGFAVGDAGRTETIDIVEVPDGDKLFRFHIQENIKNNKKVVDII